jgi:hypothetical protein
VLIAASVAVLIAHAIEAMRSCWSGISARWQFCLCS